jgi:ABC-type polar amino acid transport system ATPase subunit
MQDMQKSFGDNHELRGVDLSVHEGEVIVIIGPSGSGKSTLLRCVNHLEKIDQGKIDVDGNCIDYQEGDKGKLVELKIPKSQDRGATSGWYSSTLSCSLT